MKYILNESIKHILDERYLLNEDLSTIATDLRTLGGILLSYIKHYSEDSAEADDTKNIDIIRQELSTLNTTLSAFKKTSTNFIDKAINKLSGQVLKSSDATKIKGLTKETVQKVETLLANSSVAGETAYTDEHSGAAISVKDYLQQIKALAVSSDVSKETLLKIKENVAKIAEIITRISTAKNKNSADINGIIKAFENAFMSLKKLNNLITQLGGIDKFKTLSNAERVANAVTNILNNHAVGGGKAKRKVSENERKNLVEFTNAVDKVIVESGITIKVDTTETVDWDKRFSEAKNKQAFWESYYEKAWGENASKIRALGEPFRNQCEQLGFSAKTNPFIVFIKKYIIEKNYTIGRTVYTAIHNAVATGKLDQNMLRGSIGNKIDILSCKNLYSKQSDEIADYLTIFNTLSTSSALNPNTLFSINADNIEDESRRKYFKAILSHLNHDDKSVNQVIWVILFDTISYTSLLENSGTKPVAYSKEAVENASLRKMAEIRAAIKILNPEVSTISSRAYTNETLKSLLAKMPEAKESNRIKIGEWILAIIGQFLLPEVQEKILVDYPKLNDIKPSPLDTIKRQKQMLEFGNSMTKEQVIAILTAYENGVDDKPDTKVSFK